MDGADSFNGTILQPVGFSRCWVSSPNGLHDSRASSGLEYVAIGHAAVLDALERVFEHLIGR
jgi:hypothetical protein